MVAVSADFHLTRFGERAPAVNRRVSRLKLFISQAFA
jgi:hypothetical protein